MDFIISIFSQFYKNTLAVSGVANVHVENTIYVYICKRSLWSILYWMQVTA